MIRYESLIVRKIFKSIYETYKITCFVGNNTLYTLPDVKSIVS